MLTKFWSKIIAVGLLGSLPLFGELIQPLEPKNLLQVLPKQIDGLQINSSQAELKLDAWLNSRATRVFEGTKIVNETPVTYQVTVTIRDTAKEPQALGEFLNFTPLVLDSYEKKYIGSSPATVLKLGTERLDVKVLLLERYIAQFTIPADQLGKEEDWLKLINISALRSARTPVLKEYPKTVLVSFVDELDPKNSREYETTVPDPEAQKRNLKENEAYEKSGAKNP